MNRIPEQHAGYRRFYEKEYLETGYAKVDDPESHTFLPTLRAFVREYGLENKRCLEVGAGRGALQDVVVDYVGIDLAEAAGRHFKKPFVQASAEALPFADESFDAVWSYAVLEHIPHPERALIEIRRVLRPGGLLLMQPAWYCASWAAQGYPVRSYSDLDWKGKVIKASIAIRKTVPYRSAFIFPRRLAREVEQILLREPTCLRFKRLEPNYEKFWMSDSDAAVSLDPYECIVWFESRGDRCLSHRGRVRRFFVRTGAVVIRIGQSK